jgi:hypothetical protein
MKPITILLMLSIYLSTYQQLKANDPPMPPETHNEETDRQPGGGAPLEDHWILYAFAASTYLGLSLMRKRNEMKLRRS